MMEVDKDVKNTSTFFKDERNCRILQKLSEDYTDLETKIDEISKQLPSIQNSKKSKPLSSKHMWLLAAIISLFILLYCYYVSCNFEHFANSLTHGENLRPL